MTDILLNSFDFGIRIVELAHYLESEGKTFPLMGRLLECGAGLGVSLRVSKNVSKIRRESYVQAIKQAEEAEYLIELMVKTSYLTELQGGPLLSDCRLIKDNIKKFTGDKSE